MFKRSDGRLWTPFLTQVMVGCHDRIIAAVVTVTTMAAVYPAVPIAYLPAPSGSRRLHLRQFVT